MTNNIREEYINAHRHDWTMHQEADWWISEIVQIAEKMMLDEHWRNIHDKQNGKERISAADAMQLGNNNGYYNQALSDLILKIQGK